MNTIGKPGSSLRTPPKPTAQTVNEALALMTTLGGGDEHVRELLEETRSVAQHNEKLLSDSQVILDKADAVAEREIALLAREESVSRRESEIVLHEARALGEG